MVIAWVALGVGLLLFELHHQAFYALFGGFGALAAALFAVLLPDAVVLQIIVAVLVTVVGVVAVRPLVSRVFEQHRTGGHIARGVHGGLVGQEALTLDVVGDDHAIGHVRLGGERWLAVSGGPSIPAGTPVLVTALRGTTLTVWPVDSSRILDTSVPLLDPPTTNAPDGADGSTT
ncbi:MAG TPA: NfeD family protein [Acidimicrobiales bacterium]|jgi:membrane protein implicated in regulation of membrane protease activity